MVLIPEIVDSRYRLGQTALQVYQRVEWSKPVPLREFSASGHVEWVSSRGGSFETGLTTEPASGTKHLARSLLVARMAGDLESYGQRGLPARPELDATSLVRRRTLVVDEATIRHFAMLAGHALSRPRGRALRLGPGLPDDPGPGPAALHDAALLRRRRGGRAGRDVVPAGGAGREPARVLPEQPPTPSLWAMRLVGGGEVAAVARIAVGSSRIP